MTRDRTRSELRLGVQERAGSKTHERERTYFHDDQFRERTVTEE
jgi:hypothetical protein